MRLFSAHWLLPKWESKYLSYGQEKNSVYFNKKKKKLPWTNLIGRTRLHRLQGLKEFDEPTYPQASQLSDSFFVLSFLYPKRKGMPLGYLFKNMGPPPSLTHKILSQQLYLVSQGYPLALETLVPLLFWLKPLRICFGNPFNHFCTSCSRSSP